MRPDAFLARAEAIVGRDHVASDEATLAARGACTFPWPARLLAIVRPGSPEEAVACLALAAETGTPLHPISRGRSWGLGSALPACDAVLLDLSRLDRILDIDAQHGSVRIEPGVTFAALEAALEAAGVPFQIPAFGGPPDASVLANALDRGEGSGPHGDRYAALSDLDVGLTTGERFHTGFSRYGAEAIARVHGRPAGPLIEGLFSQSGFGCVLSGRLALAPVPAFAAYLTFEIGEAARLPAFVARAARLMREDVIAAHDLFFWDGAKRASAGAIRADTSVAEIEPALLDRFAASVAIASHHALLQNGRIALAIEALAPLAEDVAVHEEEAQTGGLRGRSDGANLRSVYWAKPRLPEGPLDPDRDRCGFLWFCPVLPMDGDALAGLADIVRAAARAHDTFCAIGAEAAHARALIGYASLAWDRDEAGADARALAAHDAMVEACAARGFLPYRLTLPGIARKPPAEGAFADVVGRLRDALDPAGILAPGRVPGARAVGEGP